MLGTAATAGINPQHVVVTEPVRGSDIPVHLMYAGMIDGVYAPDAVQRQAVADSISFFDEYLKGK